VDEDRPAATSDDDLVRAVASGSQDALAVLYDRHAEAIFRLAVRLTNDRGLAEEIVQETFLALWNRAELFDPASGSVTTWLRTIARNRAVDRLRAAARRPRPAEPRLDPGPDGETIGAGRPGSDSQPGGGPAAPEAAPERAVELAELRAALRDALADMPAEERRVILLAYQDGLSQSEIANRLGWPLGTVKTRTRRALRRLRSRLAAVDPSLGGSPSADAAGHAAGIPSISEAADR
jgi:RNA polymerase sigma-70 factor (ECF subfamily)